MKREASLVKNTFILGLGNVLPKAVSFLIVRVLTRHLDQGEIGQYDLITVLVSLLLPAVTLQIQTAAFRFLIEERGNEENENKIITNILLFTIPVSLVSLVIAFFCLFEFGYLERILICAYFFLDVYVSTIRQIARGLSKNKDYSISAILGAVGRLLFTFFLVDTIEMGLEGATAGLVISAVIESAYISIRLRILRRFKPSLLDWKSIRQMLKYSWPMVPNSLSMWVMRMSDRLIIWWVMGDIPLGIYSVANKIPSLITIAQSTFSMAWQENATIVSKDEDADAYYTAMFRAVFNFMAGAFALVIAVTPILFMLMVDEQKASYGAAYIQMPILLLGMFFFSITGYLGGIYVAYKKTASVGVTTIVAAACNLIVNVALIWFIGLYAASLSTLVSYVVLCVYRMIDLKKHVKIKYDVPYFILINIILVLISVLCSARILWIDVVNAVICVFIFVFLNRTILKALIIKTKQKLKNITHKA